MKQLTVAVILLFASLLCDSQAIKMTTYNAKFSKSEGGIPSSEIGTPASTIPQQEFGGAVVYFRMDVVNFKAIKAKYRLEIQVMEVKDGQESVVYRIESFIPNKNGFQVLHSDFKEGNYTIYVRDQEHPDDVYSKVNFVVPSKPKVDYKNNSTLVVCKSVDDSWNAVGATATVKTGECMNFLYKAKDRVPGTVMTWNVVRVKADGTEEYVTHLNQGSGGKPFRFLATGDGVCAFTTPGKYRVYLFERDNYDTGITRGDDSKFIGRTEVTVE